MEFAPSRSPSNKITLKGTRLPSKFFTNKAIVNGQRQNRRTPTTMRNVFIVFISLLILKLALIAVDDVEDVPLLAIAFATRILRTWDLASQKIL